MTDIRAAWTVAEASVRNAKQHFADAIRQGTEVPVEVEQNWFQRVVLNRPTSTVTHLEPIPGATRIDGIDNTLLALRQGVAAIDQLGDSPGKSAFAAVVDRAADGALALQERFIAGMNPVRWDFSDDISQVYGRMTKAEALAHRVLMADLHASVAPRVAEVVTGVQRELAELGPDHAIRDRVRAGMEETLRAIRAS